MTILSILATAFGSIMGFSNFFQAHRIFKRKSARDISLTTFGMLFAGALVWVLYGLELRNSPVIISNLVGVLGAGSVLIGWFKYGRNKK